MKTKQEKVYRVYKAFGQQGGTIHDLRNKIVSNKYLTERAIFAYLFQLMETDNERYVEQELRDISQQF